jgi:hypothetical protein
LRLWSKKDPCKIIFIRTTPPNTEQTGFLPHRNFAYLCCNLSRLSIINLRDAIINLSAKL